MLTIILAIVIAWLVIMALPYVFWVGVLAIMGLMDSWSETFHPRPRKP